MTINAQTDISTLPTYGVRPIRKLGGDLDYQSQEDASLVDAFGHGATVIPRARTLAEAIMSQIEENPDAVAMSWRGEEMTYAELDGASRAIAHALMSRGVAQGDVVALYMGRGFATIAAIYGVIRMGAAYAPMQRGATRRDSFADILALSHARVVITDDADEASVFAAGTGTELLALDPRLKGYRTAAPQPAGFLPHVRPSDRCVVLFDRRSDGSLVGSQITHGNLANMLLTAPGDLAMSPAVTVAQVQQLDADFAVWEILGALANGARLRLYGDDLQETVAEADILLGAPRILTRLDPERCERLRTIVLPANHDSETAGAAWRGVATVLLAFGLNETGLLTAAVPLSVNSVPLTLGRPVPNTVIRILNKNMEQVPIGEKGEICIGGAGICDGYISRLAETSTRFQPDPFQPGEILFRSRIMGRWTQSGELQFLGTSAPKRATNAPRLQRPKIALSLASAAIPSTPGKPRRIIRMTRPVTLARIPWQ